MADHLLRLRVNAVRAQTPQVRELELCSKDGGPLPRFRAGAHLRFVLPLGQGVVERCYSLINVTEQAGFYRIAVQRSSTSAGGSTYMCDEVCVGSVLTAHAPKNEFALVAGATHHLLLAGGIGITPVLSMVRALDSAGQSFTLHYAARKPDSMAYADLLRAEYGDAVHLYFDNGDPSRGMPLASILDRPATGAHAYFCGPGPMIDAVRATGQARGWSPAHLHFERFSAPAAKAGDAGIEVELARSRRTLKVGRSESILDAILAAGLDPLFDCRRGECGACAVAVLGGIPEHRDYVLTPEQRASNKTMCICVSRATSQSLVLDI